MYMLFDDDDENSYELKRFLKMMIIIPVSSYGAKAREREREARLALCVYVHIQPPWLYSIQSLFFSSQAPPFFWKFPSTEMGSLMTPDLGAKSTPGTVPGVDLAPSFGVKNGPWKISEILFQQSIFGIPNLALIG